MQGGRCDTLQVPRIGEEGEHFVYGFWKQDFGFVCVFHAAQNVCRCVNGSGKTSAI
jgi:hypothetical protein